MRITIYLIFFFSGAASLIYEIVWMRQLSVVFGATTYAIATVLAVFMGGLSIGSIVFGRFADRLRNPLVAYALIELSIGLYGVFIADFFDLLRTPYIYLYRIEPPHAGLVLGRTLLACCVLLPPTILIGGTLPILANFLVRSSQEISQRIARLYFVNTAGAVVGCAAAGFYLIEHLGNSGATHIAIAVNFMLAGGTALLFAASKQSNEPSGPSPAAPPAPLDTIPSFSIKLSMIAIGVSGFTSLAHEVLWTRALLRYLYNSTYAFTTMLVVFLAGLAIGSALYPGLPFRKNRPLLLFALLELGVAVGFVVSLLLFSHISEINGWLTGGTVNSFAESIGMLTFTAVLTFLFPTICLGATLPAATDLCARSRSGVGGTVGAVYAVNTLGSILGSLAATFLLIPYIGMSGTVAFLTACTFTIAFALLTGTFNPGKTRYLLLPAIAGSSVVVVWIVGSDVFKKTFAQSASEIVAVLSRADSELVFYKEGATDTVGVMESDGQRHIMYEDMRGTASTWSYQWNFLLGHLPVLLHPGDPKSALHICFGVGNSLSATVAHDSIESVDSVELSPHVLDAAEYFWTNDGVIRNSKVNTIIDDGRNFVMASDSFYDVILLEPPETFAPGVINLYTTEFYRLVRNRLADDGIFMQWIPVGESSTDQERMLFRSFYDVFPNGSAWMQLTRGGPILLIAGKGELRFDYTRIQAKMAAPRIRRDLDYCKLYTPEDILAMFIFGPPELAKFVDGVPAVVDNKTVLDYSMPRYIGSGFGLGQFSSKVKDKDGSVPFTVVFRRADFYEDMRVSCMPYLVNYPIDKRDQIETTIMNKRLPATVLQPIPEKDWKKWDTKSASEQSN